MDFEALATFVRIVESGSLTAAARSRRQSLPSVSRQLRALEDDLGVTLVRRTTRRLAVTLEGRNLYDHAAHILREVEAAREGARAGRLRGSLTVSVGVTMGQILLVPRLPALLRQHPGLRIDLRIEDRLTDLIVEGVDLVVRAGAPLPDSASLIATPLLQFNRILVAAPAYLRGHEVPRDPAALARHECLLQLGNDGMLARWTLLRGDEERVVEVRGRFSSTAPLALQQCAIAGAGLALLPRWLVAQDVAAKRLRHVLPKWCSPAITAWAIYRKELRASPAIRAFLEAMARLVE